MKIRNKIKKMLALTLALSLSVGMLHIPTDRNLVNAATEETSINITGLSLDKDYLWPKKNGYWNIWQIYVNTDAKLPEGTFNIILKDNTTTSIAEFSKFSDNIAYIKIEGDFLPENAAKTFTISEGTYISDSNTQIKITNNYSIHLEGGVWTPVGKTDSLAVEKYVKLDIGTAWDKSNTGDTGHIYLHKSEDDGIAVSEDWTNRLEPVCADVENGIFYGSAAWFADTSDGKAETRNSSYKTAVRFVKFANTNDAGYSYSVVLSDYGISATENDLVRFGGYWKDNETGKIYKFAPMTFKFNGTNWEDVTDSDGDSYSGSLRVKDSAYDKGWITDDKIVSTNLYLKGVDSLGAGITSDDWSSTWLFDVANSDGTVKIDGTQVTDIEFRKYSGNGNYYYLNKLSNVNKDSVVTIEGKFKFSGGTVTFDKREYKWDGKKWIDIMPNTGKLTTSGAETESKNATGSIYLKGTDSYLSDRTYDDWNVPGTRLVASDENSGVYAGDTKISATLIKYSASNNWYYIETSNADLSKNLTVKGTFMTPEGVPVLNIEQSKFHWDGTKWVDGYKSNFVDVSVTGFHEGITSNPWYYPTYDSDEKGWRIYMKTDAELPGADYDGYYNLIISKDGSETNVKFIRSGKNEIYGYIPNDMINTNQSQTITFKAGKYMAEKDGNQLEYGIELKNSFDLYINKNGWSFEALIEPDYENNARFVTLTNKTVQNGIYIKTNVDDGLHYCEANEDWVNGKVSNKSITNKTYYYGGLYKNGEKITTGQNVVYKISETEYYFALSDNGIQPTEAGDIYVIKGLYEDVYGKTTLFKETTVRWNGTSWEFVYTPLSDTGVKYDINSDGKVDVRDLVALKIYLNDNMYSINNNQADINGGGSIDEDDIDRLRMHLAGAWSVNEDGSISGIPTYNTERTFNKAAYASVKIGEWDAANSEMTSYYDEDTVNKDMQKYKSAGLNLLITEGIASHLVDKSKNTGIKAYLEAAERNNLGVLVTSEALFGFAAYGPEEYLKTLQNSNIYKEYATWKDVVDDIVAELKGYSKTAFKGFMIADEVLPKNKTSTDGNVHGIIEYYTEVAKYISDKYPELIIHSSQLPVSSDYFSSAATESEYKEYISQLTNANNMFTFDLYPLKKQEKKGNMSGKVSYSLNLGLDDWFNGHKLIADVCKSEEKNYNFNKGITIQSCQEIYSGKKESLYTYTDIGYAPTFSEDIGFQVFTSMAYGVKEINFWTYNKHHTNTAISESIADNPEVYNAVQTINVQVDNFANVYLAYDWRDTFDIADNTSYTTTSTASDNGRLQLAKAEGARTLIGHMKDVEGFDGYMIANATAPRTDVDTKATNATTVKLNFKDATKAVVYDYQAGTRKVIDLTDGTLTVTVNVGEGTFVIPVK